MYCQKCGAQLPDTAKFCNGCGVQTADTQPIQKRGRNRATVFFIGLVCTVALGGIGVTWLALEYANSSSRSNNLADSTHSNNPAPSTPAVPVYDPPPPPPSPPRPVETEIVNDSFALPSGYFKTYPIRIGKGGKVSGRFEAQGGIDDAIRVVITDNDGFINMRNGNRYLQWYDSGEVTVANINAQLGPGDYLLVYSNRGSLTNRTIRTRVHLSDCCY